MPFIRGRYHINAVAGEALEAAREAEAALLALQHGADSADDSSADGAARGNRASSIAKAPIHRVEIEAAETVPAHTGRAQRGFVARIHRATVSGNGSRNDAPDAAPNDDFASDDAPNTASAASRRPGTDNLARIASASTAAPETHVFAHPADLVNFLHNEFANDTSTS